MEEQHIFKLEDGRVKIKGLYIDLPIEKTKQLLFSWEHGNNFKGYIGGLGTCKLTISGSKNVDYIIITTERKFTEEETLAIMDQVSTDFSAKPGFDYNDYGVVPKPHEIDYFWDISEGFVTIRWDGFNVGLFSSKKNDGLDYIEFCIRRPVVKDEAYWRSEVD